MSKPTPGPWENVNGAVIVGPEVNVTDSLIPKDMHEQTGIAATASIVIATLHHECMERQENAALIVAACNAIQAAAEKLGEDPIELAERLGEGYLVEPIRQDEENA